MIRKSDLPHVTGRTLSDGSYLEPERPLLFCPGCGAEWSAEPGDYWRLPADYAFACTDCNRPLTLVRKRAVYEDWPIEEHEP